MITQSNMGHAFIPVNWLLDALTPEGIGEMLRELTFPGEGYGCYSTFDVREDAEKWDQTQRYAFWQGYWSGTDFEDFDRAAEAAGLGDGYTWRVEGLSVDVCWYWDGDGTLAFIARGDGVERGVVNTDCKKDYGWEDLP